MLAIKKRVNLDFLGEEFKEAFIIFRAVPIKDFEEIISDTPDDTKEAIKHIRDILKKYYLSGRVPDDKGEISDMKKEEIDELDGDASITCFEILTGQSAGGQTDPLASESESPSKTEAPVLK